ncbi:MAG TPA: hypothetical protein VF018_07855 [Acidobacteriaceae bacterium]
MTAMLRMDKCWWRGVLWLTGLSLLMPMRGLAVQTTNVQGTVYRADGSVAQGMMLVSWQGFTAADGSAVAAGNMTVTIAPDGSVNMALAPNAGANPQGSYYTVVYHMSDGTVQKEYWVVPQGPTATISQLRAKVVPAAVAQQSVTQQYVDTSISTSIGALQGSYLRLQGGTMGGALNLSGDPTSALQATTKQYVDSATAGLSSSVASKLPLTGGALTGPLTLAADPGSAMQAATKEYVDAHVGTQADWNAAAGSAQILNKPNFAAVATSGSYTDLSGRPTLPASAIVGISDAQALTNKIVDGVTPAAMAFLDATSSIQTQLNGKLHAAVADVSGLYSSTQYNPATVTWIDTAFGGTASASINGTKPEIVDTPGSSWVATSGGTYFLAGGGLGLSSGGGAGLLNGGKAQSAITWTNVTLTSGDVDFAMNANPGYTQALVLSMNVSAHTWTLADYGVSPASTLASGSFTGNSGNIVMTIGVGGAVSGSAFGNAFSGTLASNSATLTNTYIAVNPHSGTGSAKHLTQMAAGYAPSTIACSGFYNSDGTCSTSGANSFVVNDNNGHQASLPEKGTVTTTTLAGAQLTSIAWQDDLKAGVYDPRDPRWGNIYGTPLQQAQAAQAMSNQMACDLTTGVVSNAVAKWPQGSFYIDKLFIAPGSSWEGAATSTGGTQWHSLYNNHLMAQIPQSMTVTCADGASHTDSASAGHISHFSLQGCANGGCSNAPGDTGIYANGGPGNNGIEISDTAGMIEHVTANYFGGYGIRVDGQDTKAYHNSVNNNLNWYYYGYYKGAGESLVSPEASVTTTGATSSVTLSWSAVTGATGYIVYRGTTPGGENVFYKTTTNSFTDTGAAANGGPNQKFSTTGIAAPGTITPTSSTTGGTLAAGTYYYTVTSLGADPSSIGSWYGSAELIGTDVMADGLEAYGLFDQPTVFTYHHLADIVTGGGDGHFDHLWPQLGQVGIAQPYAAGLGTHIENVRVDFARLEGIWINDPSVWIQNGIVDGSCTGANALTINTGQDSSFYAGKCDQLASWGGNTNVSGVWFSDNNGFGPTYKTADIMLNDAASAATNVIGAKFEFFPAQGVKGGYLFQPSTSYSGSITGPVPNIQGLWEASPVDTSPITYTGFTGAAQGQNLYLIGGNSNVTLQNNPPYLVTCSGQNINMGNVRSYLEFHIWGGNYNRMWEVCDDQPTVGSSETVAFSATPTFSPSTRASMITLTANITSFTLAAGVDGQEKTLTFCQNGTGGFTVGAPANVHGFFTVGTTASKCSAQHFTYSAGQAAWLADSPGVANE